MKNPRMNPFLQFAQKLKWRAASDRDAVVLIDGDEGDGKSTYALHLARTIDPEFSIAQLIENEEEWDTAFFEAPPGTVFIIDEGEKLLLSWDWNSQGSKWIVKVIMQARQRRLIILICHPNLHWLNAYFREHRLHYRIHVLRRGLAIQQIRRKNWRDGGTWFEDEATHRFPGFRPNDPLWTAYLPHKHRNYAESLDTKYSNRGRGPKDGEAVQEEVERAMEENKLLVGRRPPRKAPGRQVKARG